MDVFSFVPNSIKEKLAQSLIDFIVEQAGELVGEGLAAKLAKLSTKTEFRRAVDEAVERAMQRFRAQYALQDPDLVAALESSTAVWLSPQVQQAIAQVVRQPGAWRSEDRTLIEEHFVGLLGHKVERVRVNHAVAFLLKCVAEELWAVPGAQEIREIYSLQFQKHTADAVRAQVQAGQRQLAASTQLNAELRDALLQLVAALENRLLPGPPPSPLTAPRPIHNLPRPDYVRFVGREQELAWLRQRLSPQHPGGQIALTGIGGVGKSALALAIAHEYCRHYESLPADERFEAIIWVSAKEKILTAHGTEKASLPGLVLRTLEDMYTSIAQTLEREDITRALEQDQSRLVERALRRQRTLLVIDNLENVKDDRIRPFLRSLPVSTKAVLTSREWLDTEDVLRVTGLPRQEAEDLIAKEADARDVTLDESQRTSLFRLTSGLPLPIKLGIARLASGEHYQAVTRWLDSAAGELSAYCISGQVELVRSRDPNTVPVLLACSLFDRQAGASRQALASVAALLLPDTDRALPELQRHSLLNRTQNHRFWTLPVVQRYAHAQLADATLGRQLTQRWLAWLMSFAQATGAELERNTERLNALGVEYPNLLSGIRWCREQGQWEPLFKLAEGTWGYAYGVSLFHEASEIVEAVSDAVKSTHDERQTGWIALRRGRLYLIQKNYGQALDCFERAEKIALKYKKHFDLATAWASRAYICLEQGKLAEAEKLIQTMSDTGKQLGDIYMQLLAFERLGKLETMRGRFEAADEALSQAQVWAEASNASRRLCSVLYRRGINEMAQNHLIAAEQFLLQSFELGNSTRERRYEAYSQYRLASVYERMGNTEQARHAALQARDLFERLGLTPEQAQLEEFLHHLPQADPAT